MLRKKLVFEFATNIILRKNTNIILNAPACFDSGEAAMIDSHRCILVLLYDKEHIIDELSGHDLSLFPSSLYRIGVAWLARASVQPEGVL